MEIINLPGMWYCRIKNAETGEEKDGVLRVPGSLDESEIGFPEKKAKPWHPDARIQEIDYEEGITTRLTRRFTFEGPAFLQCDFLWSKPDQCRVFLDVQRARCLKVTINGKEAEKAVPFSLSAPQSFEVTDCVRGLDHIEIISDNSYPGLPHDDIVFSSEATDETQTNWNGLLGYVRYRLENPVFLENLRVFPHGETVDVCVTVNADRPWKGELRFYSPALRETACVHAEAGKGRTEIRAEGLLLREDVHRWDLGDGTCFVMTAAADGLDTVSVRFGVRDFGTRDGHFTLNGRIIHLRAEANCAVFPETGYEPMTPADWDRVLRTYRSYGVNCMRFHSHVPPEAAFEAADALGMLMQPELPCWNPRNAFEDDKEYAFYRDELDRTLDMLANHPSFVMFTFGNELHAGELGHRRMSEMLARCREKDSTRLYANASNPHYGSLGCDPDSDFYTSQRFEKLPLRGSFSGMSGHVNRTRPSECVNYSEGMQALRATYPGPVISFEVGQYEVLPDFAEIDDFHGVTRPDNFEAIRKKAEKAGMAENWKQRVEATGELSLLCYREEMEANLRTPEIAGISLLGLQDFPGQGTALVGMLNSHLCPKPYAFARPERFEAFFRDVLPLAELKKYTYEPGEVLEAVVKIANYGKEDLTGCLTWRVAGDGWEMTGSGSERSIEKGSLGEAGMICLTLPERAHNGKLELKVCFAGHENSYPLWLYPETQCVCPASVYETACLDEKAMQVLAAGGKVYLTPPSTKEALPHSIQAQFSTDFWSVGCFPNQEGGMGQLIDAEHPLFDAFPTAFHSEWQWWPMAGRRAVILPEDCRVHPIITEMDSYATMRSMAKLFECRTGGGRLMFSSMGLQDLMEYPEARALQRAIYAYMDSDRFAPQESVDIASIRGMLG